MKEEQEKLIKKKLKLLEGGGEKSIQKQHTAGKLTARERLDLLFDPDTFIESGLFAEHRCTHFGMEAVEAPCDGVITGHGKINGRLTFVAAQDFTVMGGSLGETHASKIAAIQEAALQAGAPIIYINDSGGARIQEGVDALAGYGRIFYNCTLASGVIPQISAIMGPCAGGAVYAPALTDFVFMVENISQMFITGPQVISAVTGEEVTAQSLGGALVHNSISGCAHFLEKSEESCLEHIRCLLQYLPQNNYTTPQITLDVPAPDNNALDDLIPDSPNYPYDMLDAIHSLADASTFFEYQKYFATNIITGFMKLGGRPIGIIANQPMDMAGCLDYNAADKAARFIRTCDSFQIPLLTLVDVPGFLPGLEEEHHGIIRHGAKMLYAYSEATVPMATVILRKAYGGAYIGMCSKHLGADLVLAWPSAEIAVMGASGAANIIFKKAIKAAKDPEAERLKKIEEYQQVMMNPYVAASRGYVDDIIMPHETQLRLIEFFDAYAHKRKLRPHKKHGNIPL